MVLAAMVPASYELFDVAGILYYVTRYHNQPGCLSQGDYKPGCI